MKITIVHNEYGKFSGEEAVVANQEKVLKTHGHEVSRFTRNSADLSGTLLGRPRGFFSGIYNPFSRHAFRRHLAEFRPDIVHIHNLFPLISPSILPECRKHGVPLVMTLHNFRLVCPNALLLRDGKPCHECLGGHEWRCIRHNCEKNIGKSVGYALRTANARRRRYFLDNVNLFLCLTEFQRRIHISEGFPGDKCVVVPGFLAEDPFSVRTASPSDSQYALYVGRVTPERDIPTLLEAAAQCPDIPLKIAGSYWRMPELQLSAPRNVEFLGEVNADELSHLYANARLVVFATRCYEGFPMVLLETMARSKPVICANIGGMREIIRERVTGLLYQPGNPNDLAAKLGELWHNQPLCTDMGNAGRDLLNTNYSAEQFYQRLLEAYAKVRK